MIKYISMQFLSVLSIYQFLINKRKKVGLKHCNNPKAFIECSNNMQYVYEILKNTIQEKTQSINSF